ncbi:hypothetical protein [Aquimarina sp. RZ0]|uniref:IS66 family insertion sequence element accessory protein TnpA n=1 Tax=Aquimarina sp. RZ0 TaxID=2607730 RepID=UPI0011F1FDA3|nr:hypothetical protein [Aquimarina sp. RZ0]KAA1242779.1 hypothetical protein F0000_24185 [Aquimarina sp. RZ0]
MSQLSESKRMEELVSSYHSSGQTQKDFAKAHVLTEGKLHYWIKKLSVPLEEEEPLPEFIPLDLSFPGRESKFIIILTADGMKIQIPV